MRRNKRMWPCWSGRGRLECCTYGKEMAVYYSRRVSSMTLNDAASGPHAGERVFNLKGIRLCSTFTIFYTYEPESERKIGTKMWMFCFAIKEILDSSKIKHLQIYHSKCDMIFLKQEKFRESKWTRLKALHWNVISVDSCHIKQFHFHIGIKFPNFYK